jgi:hypothetical protein
VRIRTILLTLTLSISLLLSATVASAYARSGHGSPHARAGRIAHATTIGSPITGAVATPLPSASGPLPTTSHSYPFNATKHNFTPRNLAKVGYRESEYLVNGKANVYSWPSLGTITPTVSGRYKTRIIVRRPSNPRKFSGNVVVEMLNPTSLFDVDIVWAADQNYFVSHGDIWVGITVKPSSIAALKVFDPARYAGLSMANPVPASQTCAKPNGGGSPATENGLAWDMVSQVGTLLQSGARDNPLRGLPIKDEYLTGYSQTGGYEVTYINAIAPHFVRPNGEPIFAGYLIGTGYGFVEPINQCTPAPAAGSGQWIVHPPANAPVIDVQTLSDSYALGGSSGVRPDGDGPGNNYRLYQVPGASHVWAEQVRYAPGPSEELKAGFPANYWFPYCAQDVNNFPLQYPMDGAFADLIRWVRDGVSAPEIALITSNSSDQIETDANGNALGGLRTPYVDVPTETYYGTTPGTGTCESLWGRDEPFARYYLKTLYPTHVDYVSKVTQDVDNLVGEHYLTAADGHKIIARAADSRVP